MARGGKRAGSGRKAVDTADKRVQLVITIAPETKIKLEQLAESKGIPKGRPEVMWGTEQEIVNEIKGIIYDKLEDMGYIAGDKLEIKK